MDFSTRPTPDGMDAGLSYAGGEAITAWKGLQERLRRSEAPAPAPTSAPAPADSWAGRRAELREKATRDLPAARELARSWLEGGLPPTAGGEALRAEAQRVLALESPAPPSAPVTAQAVPAKAVSPAPSRAAQRLAELIRGEEPVTLRLEALSALCRRAEREPAAADLAEELLLECTFAAELPLRLRATKLLGLLP
jgi:hypothetical protein